MSTRLDLQQSADPPPAAGGVFDGLIAARHDDGYAAGYRRAINDLLADLILLGEEFAHDAAAAATRGAVRTFARGFEQHAELTRAGPAAGGDAYVADGLGI